MNLLQIYSPLILSGLLISACTPKTHTSSEETNQQQKSQRKAGADEDTYTVSLPKNGSEFMIKPKLGFKINADFPHRAILKAGGIVETAVTDHTEKRLIFKMIAESKLPTAGVEAETSFSVCNDQMCKLYKESYKW